MKFPKNNLSLYQSPTYGLLLVSFIIGRPEFSKWECKKAPKFVYEWGEGGLKKQLKIRVTEKIIDKLLLR